MTSFQKRAFSFLQMDKRQSISQSKLEELIQLRKNNQPLPPGYFQDEYNSFYYQDPTDHITDEEINGELQLSQAQSLKTIKNILIFFLIVFIVGLVVGILIQLF